VVVNLSGSSAHFDKTFNARIEGVTELDQKMKLILALVVILTVFNTNVGDDTVQSTPADRTKKLTVLNRLFNAKATDYIFTVDRLEEQIAGDAGYALDATLGRVALRYQDMPDCPLLMPIYKLSQPISTNHILMVSEELVTEWYIKLITSNQGKSNWQYIGVIGFGVLNKNECGATAQVRHFSNEIADVNSQSMTHILTTNDTEAADLPTRGIKRSNLPSFYIWQA